MNLFTEILIGLLVAASLAACGLGLAYRHQIKKNASLSAQVVGLKGALDSSIKARAAADLAVLSRDRSVQAARPAFKAATEAAPEWSDERIPDTIQNSIKRSFE